MLYTGAEALTLADVPDGTGRIWLDNVQCTGIETTLISCPRNALGDNNCVHSEDAGVNCLCNSLIIFLFTECLEYPSYQWAKGRARAR